MAVCQWPSEPAASTRLGTRMTNEMSGRSMGREISERFGEKGSARVCAGSGVCMTASV